MRDRWPASGLYIVSLMSRISATFLPKASVGSEQGIRQCPQLCSKGLRPALTSPSLTERLSKTHDLIRVCSRQPVRPKLLCRSMALLDFFHLDRILQSHPRGAFACPVEEKLH